MEYIKVLAFLLLTLPWVCGLRAQTVDSVDVVDYDVAVDLSGGVPFAGDASLTVRLAAGCQTLELDFVGSVDSVWVDGQLVAGSGEPVAGSGWWLEGSRLIIQLVAGSGEPVAGEPVERVVRILYHGDGYVENYGFGGFHFDGDMSYNLGVGFMEEPHVMGRVLMPCRDNFHDKATYTLRVTTHTGWTAECSGVCMSREPAAGGGEESVWRIDQPVPTYLVGVSEAAFRRVQSEVSSVYGTYPLTLGWRDGDSTRVRRAFAELDSVVPMYERCMGPYRWHRIGYIATARGSMEHVNNIALAKEFMTSTAERAQMTIAHELGHAWFGNLVTCRTEADMWFNEGGASFTSELAMEATKGREAAQKYYQTNLETVVRQAHVTDHGYLALSPMPHAYTYGSTTYDKGALVWHSLRGYLGEEVFYNAIGRLFSDKAFGTVDALEVRDSLAAYTGTDLTDFFDFHVFTPGFVDYHLHLDEVGCLLNEVGVFVRQQGVGTTATSTSSRVPVTFFSSEGDTAKRVLAFEGAEWYDVVSLPFEPAYYVLDRDMEFSDAATLAEFRKGGSTTALMAHVKIGGSLPENTSLFVEHHWGRPWDLDTLTGLRRAAGRYWVVSGAQGQYAGTQMQLHYVREGYTNGNYPYLDPGLIVTTASLDSVVVLYREGYGLPWQAITHQSTGNNNEGWFVVDNVRTGEYTLAVVDTALLGLTQAVMQPDNETPVLFPNPVHPGEPLIFQLAAGSGEQAAFTVRIFDAAGRQVWKKKGVRNGRKFSPSLASGTYLVRIENNFVSLQSKLIVL